MKTGGGRLSEWPPQRLIVLLTAVKHRLGALQQRLAFFDGEPELAVGFLDVAGLSRFSCHIAFAKEGLAGLARRGTESTGTRSGLQREHWEHWEQWRNAAAPGNELTQVTFRQAGAV